MLRSAYFPQRVHSTLCSKTLDLQVRCTHPTGNFAPKRLFKPFRCSAWLISFRTDPPSVRRCFARLIRQAETLELQPHSRPPSKRTALSVGNKHMLQVRCAHPAPSHRNAPSGHSGVPHGLFSFRTDPPSVRRCFARLIRQAETLELQPHSRPPSKRTALSIGYKHMLQVRCAHPTGNFAPPQLFELRRCSARLI